MFGYFSLGFLCWISLALGFVGYGSLLAMVFVCYGFCQLWFFVGYGFCGLWFLLAKVFVILSWYISSFGLLAIVCILVFFGFLLCWPLYIFSWPPSFYETTLVIITKTG